MTIGQPGTQVVAGRYRLEAPIGSGGMGIVWRAIDELLGRPVAVKILRETLADDALAGERFRREALAAAALSHPGFANVFDLFEADGRPAIAMELVEGETLAERLLRDGPIDVDEAVDVATQMLDALATAHAAGVIHRDIKPANVLLASDRVKVTDLGIASVSGTTALTQTGALMATPHYVAPEQLLGKPATFASDLYSLGAVLYEMLTGVRPFEGETSVAVAMSRLTVTPQPPSRHRNGIPPALEAVVLRALAVDPADRFSDAAAMRAALDDALAEPWSSTMVLPAAEAATTTLPRATTEPARSRLRRPRTAWLIGPLALGAGLILLLGSALLPQGAIAAPTLEGLTLSDARATAEELGVDLRVERAPSVAPTDRVIEQRPAAGEELDARGVITVTVSDGTLRKVPVVAGRPLDEARALLERRGLQVGDITRAPTAGVEPNTVLMQDPHGGTVEEGTAVDLTIAVAPPPPQDEGKDEKKDEDDGRRGKGRGNDD